MYAAAADLRPHNASWSESDKCLRLILTVGSARLDLRNLPARRIELSFAGTMYNPDAPTTAEEWSVSTSATTDTVSIAVREGRQVDVLLFPGRKLLSVWASSSNANKTRLGLAHSPVHVLALREISADLSRQQHASIPLSSLQLHDARVIVNNRQINQLSMKGRCYYKATSTDVGALTVREQVQLTGFTAYCHIGSVFCQSSPGADVSAPQLILAGDSHVHVRKLKDLKVVLAKGARLSAEDASDVQCRGAGSFQVTATARQITFLASGTPPTAPLLLLDRYSQLVGASGSVRLGAVAGASLSGVARPTSDDSHGHNRLVIEGLPEEPEELDGVTLINVDIPVTLQGLRMIAKLSTSAHQVTPALHQALPGLGPLAGFRLSAFRHPRSDGPHLLLQSQYASALSELASKTRAPASVRTRLAWCTYRLRNLVAPGRTERTLLTAYRAIGYGERVMPALCLYIFLAVVMTSLALVGQELVATLTGLKYWLRGYLDWLITPLHVLKLTGERKESDFALNQPWDTLARLPLAIPFATAVLALRKYVKEDAKR